MDYFGSVLNALHYLLAQTGADKWAKWIANDIMYWRADNSIEHYLSAYGGSGSLNDLVLSASNGHKVTKEQEPWANMLLHVLNSIGCMLATSNTANERAETEEILTNLGGRKRELNGLRCPHCGYSEISASNIDYYIAPLIVSSEIYKELGGGNFKKVSASCLEMKPLDIHTERIRIKHLMEDCSIIYTNNTRLKDACVKCGKNGIAACRWSEKRVKKFWWKNEKNLLVIEKA